MILAVPAREVRVIAASSVVLALAVPGDTAFPDCSGVLVATGERLRAKAITLSSKKWGTRADVQLLRLSFGRFGDQVAARTPDEELRPPCSGWMSARWTCGCSAGSTPCRSTGPAMPSWSASCARACRYLDGIGVPACVGAAGRAVEALQAEVAP